MRDRSCLKYSPGGFQVCLAALQALGVVHKQGVKLPEARSRSLGRHSWRACHRERMLWERGMGGPSFVKGKLW